MCIIEFYNNVLNTLTDNQYIQVTIKIKYIEDNDVISYRSLTALQSIRNVTSDRVEFLTIAKGKLDLKSNYYLCTNVDKITFVFRILEFTPDLVLPIFDRRHQLKEKNISQKYTFAGYNLPLPSTMDYRYFGDVVIESNNIIIIKGPLGYTFRITLKKNSDCNIIQILPKNSNYSNIDILLNNVTTVQVVSDYPQSTEDSSTFRREVDNVTYHFQQGELSSKNQIRKTSFIKPIIKNKKIITNKLLTLDIETTQRETVDEKTGKIFSVLSVYLISVYDGKKATSFYIDDFKNEVELINAVISFLLSGPYNNKVVYVHNLAKFDSVFLIKYLATSKDCYMDKPLMKDGRFIQITIKVGEVEPYTLKFMDSLQMLPQSLKSLAKQFNVEEKGLFPVLMPKPELFEAKEGFFPDFKFFGKITEDEYLKFKSEFKGDWDFRNESIKYCEQDCITLYQVISKFNKLIFERFSKNIWEYPTLPSLALAIFRSNYLEDNKIPRLTGKISDDIRDGFTGGSTDMFIPYSNKPIYVYDVNSLYPYVMAMFDMPIGKIQFFEGDITKIDPDAFGFFEVIVTAPDNLETPILQTHVKTSGGTRTISPLGTWRGVYFSEEIRNAREFGYKFEILKGYTFERGKIFDGYINNLYGIKQDSHKADAMYLISKLLMNSLFGRFSMDYDLSETVVITTTLFDEISKGLKTLKRSLSKKRSYEFSKEETTAEGMPIKVKQLVTEFINFGDDKYMATIETLFDPENEEQVEHFFGKGHVSIAISAAITAYARIHMSQFKKPGQDFKIYYTDTDSIFIDKPLDPSFIGPELGKMKLEYVLEESVFLASKVYGGHIQGDETAKDICKVKGFKKKVHVSELKSLLSKEKILKSIFLMKNDLEILLREL